MTASEKYERKKIQRLIKRMKAEKDVHEAARLAEIAYRKICRLRDMNEDWDDSLHPRDKDGKFTNKGGITSPVVNGPSMSKEYIKQYCAEHKGIEAEAKQYKSVLSNVKSFAKNHPPEEEGTYDAVTGEMIDPKDLDGYCVTFHQNLSLDDPYGAYTDDDYAAMCAIAKNELGCKGVNIGYFGGAAEVSFTCADQTKVVDFAITHNQHSVFDPSEGIAVKNKYFDPKTNIIEGHDD